MCADIVFAKVGESGGILDDLVHRHLENVPSIFTKNGFGVFTQEPIKLLERHKTEFKGFANEARGRLDFLECLMAVDVPRGFVKLAFLAEGYGGSPPDEVFQWLRKNG